MTHARRNALCGAVAAIAAAALAMPMDGLAATGCSTSTKKCIVEITVSGTAQSPTYVVDPDELHIKEADRGKEYKIVFKVLPAGSYVFKTAQGDGVVLKDADQDEFYEGGPTNKDDASPPTTKHGWNRYKWTYINSVDGRYRYKVIFHDAGGTNLFTVDPVITNLDTQ